MNKQKRLTNQAVLILLIIFHAFLGGLYVQSNYNLLSPLARWDTYAFDVSDHQCDNSIPDVTGVEDIRDNIEVHSQTTEEQIIAYIWEKFGYEAESAFAILSCENGKLDPYAINIYNSDGSIDVGIFQINSIHGYSVEYLQDWKNNIDMAYGIFERDGWSAWSCSWKIGVTPFYLK